jgi:hypothetical protein
MLDEQWEYGPTLAFSNGSLAGLTQLSALYVRLVRPSVRLVAGPLLTAHAMASSARYVTGFNMSISDANWLPSGVHLDQMCVSDALAASAGSILTLPHRH